MQEIKGIARVKFLPGKLAEWKRLTEQAMEIVRTKDTGTLQYEIFFNADESEAIVFERYRDAGEVLGTPNAEMRKNLTGDQPKLFTPWLALQDGQASSE